MNLGYVLIIIYIVLMLILGYRIHTANNYKYLKEAVINHFIQLPIFNVGGTTWNITNITDMGNENIHIALKVRNCLYSTERTFRVVSNVNRSDNIYVISRGIIEHLNDIS